MERAAAAFRARSRSCPEQFSSRSELRLRLERSSVGLIYCGERSLPATGRLLGPLLDAPRGAPPPLPPRVTRLGDGLARLATTYPTELRSKKSRSKPRRAKCAAP